MKINKNILLKNQSNSIKDIIKWFGALAIFFFACTSFFELNTPKNFVVLNIISVICLVKTLCNLSMIKSYYKPTLVFSIIGTIFLPFDYILNNLCKGNNIYSIIIIGILFIQLFLITINILNILNDDISPITTNNKLTKSLFFIIPFFSMVTYWKGVFPYYTATDTDWQLAQIATGTYSDVHPAAHTLFLKLIMKIYDSPATVVLIQIILITIITGFCLKYFYDKGVSDKILMPILIFWSCLLSVKQFTTYLFKDIFYAIAIMLLTFMLIKLLEKKEKSSIWEIIITGISLAAIMLFRHNGMIIIICIIPALIYYGFKYSKKILISLLVFAIIVVPVKTIVYDAYNVLPNDNGTKYALPAKAIVSVVKYNGNYTDEQLEKIEQLMPQKAIEINYNRKLGQYLIWRDLMEEVDGYDYTFAESLEGKEKLIIELFFELLPQNFFIMAWDIIGSMSLMVQFQPNFLWHNMTFMFILAILIFAIFKKYKKVYLVAFIPTFANIASILISNISFEERYAYPTIMCFAFLLIYTFFIFKTGEKKTKFLNKKTIID